MIFRLLFGIFLVINNLSFSQTFEPMTDAAGYTLHFFAVDGEIVIPDTLVASIEDTLVISWHQPKSDDTTGTPLPYFVSHKDTIELWIQNESTLYKYRHVGNDSSIWVTRDVELYGGYWELAITCTDLAGNESQYSEPFRFRIKSIPGQPYEVNVIIKRKTR